MSIVLAGTDFGITIHGSVQQEQWDAPIVRQAWFGVLGEATLIGRNHGRALLIDGHLSGYNSHLLLTTALNNLQNLRGLYGTLSVDIPFGALPANDYDDVLFEGIMPTEAPWLDGSGTNGWQMDCRLTFRQSANQDNDNA
jgi:hypothetical protein